jgi:hypothetical protein
LASKEKIAGITMNLIDSYAGIGLRDPLMSLALSTGVIVVTLRVGFYLLAN